MCCETYVIMQWLGSLSHSFQSLKKIRNPSRNGEEWAILINMLSFIEVQLQFTNIGEGNNFIRLSHFGVYWRHLWRLFELVALNDVPWSLIIFRKSISWTVAHSCARGKRHARLFHSPHLPPPPFGALLRGTPLRKYNGTFFCIWKFSTFPLFKFLSNMGVQNRSVGKHVSQISVKSTEAFSIGSSLNITRS